MLRGLEIEQKRPKVSWGSECSRSFNDNEKNTFVIKRPYLPFWLSSNWLLWAATLKLGQTMCTVSLHIVGVQKPNENIA